MTRKPRHSLLLGAPLETQGQTHTAEKRGTQHTPTAPTLHTARTQWPLEMVGGEVS